MTDGEDWKGFYKVHWKKHLILVILLFAVATVTRQIGGTALFVFLLVCILAVGYIMIKDADKFDKERAE